MTGWIKEGGGGGGREASVEETVGEKSARLVCQSPFLSYQCVEGSTNSRALTTTSVPSAPAPDKYYLNKFSFLANIFHRDSVGRECCCTSAAEQSLACTVLSYVCLEPVVTNSIKTLYWVIMS